MKGGLQLRRYKMAEKQERKKEREREKRVKKSEREGGKKEKLVFDVGLAQRRRDGRGLRKWQWDGRSSPWPGRNARKRAPTLARCITRQRTTSRTRKTSKYLPVDSEEKKLVFVCVELCFCIHFLPTDMRTIAYLVLALAMSSGKLFIA